MALVLEACYAAGGAAAVPNVAPACLADLVAANLGGFTGCLVTGVGRREVEVEGWGGKGEGSLGGGGMGVGRVFGS